VMIGCGMSAESDSYIFTFLFTICLITMEIKLNARSEVSLNYQLCRHLQQEIVAKQGNLPYL
jgi:hypothetical protein